METSESSPRENFPNVEHYEFSETNLHSMNQLNALAQVSKFFHSFTFTFTPTIITSTFTYKLQVELFQLFLPQVQGITSLTIGEEGNPLYAKNWRPYAIFRWQFCKCANVTFCALLLWHLCKQLIFLLEMLNASILGSNIGGSSTWTIKRWEVPTAAGGIWKD